MRQVTVYAMTERATYWIAISIVVMSVEGCAAPTPRAVPLPPPTSDPAQPAYDPDADPDVGSKVRDKLAELMLFVHEACATPERCDEDPRCAAASRQCAMQASFHLYRRCSDPIEAECKRRALREFITDIRPNVLPDD